VYGVKSVNIFARARGGFGWRCNAFILTIFLRAGYICCRVFCADSTANR
jgi:hypothetical protein